MDDSCKQRSNAYVWLVATVLVSVGSLVWLIAITMQEFSVQLRLLPPVCRRYGIDVGTPYVLVDCENRECIVFTRVDTNSPLGTAGVQIGDILHHPTQISEFAQLLNKPSGQPIEFAVLRRDNRSLTHKIRIAIVAP